MSYYRRPRWAFDPMTGEILHFKGGQYNEGEAIKQDDIDIKIPTFELPELVEILTEHGFIRPTMSKDSREEDLKIVHRLLDLCDKKIREGD